jgi:hypothetical protein
MKKIYTIIVVLALILVGAFTVMHISLQKPTTTSPIKVGVSLPITGDAASLGEFIKNVSDMAIEKINAEGGIHGRNIELRYEDDACNPAKAVSVAQKLISVDKVKLMVLSTCSGAAIPVIPITTKNGVFVFSGVTTSQDLTGVSPLFARTVPSNASQGQELAKYAISKGFKNIAIVYETTDYPVSIKKSFTDVYTSDKGKVTEEGFTAGTTDFRSILTKIKAENPDAIFFIPGSPAVADRLTNSFEKLKWDVPLIGGDIFSGNSEVVKKYKPAHLGSSIGITIAKTQIELKKALLAASLVDSEVLVEKLMKNFIELNVSVRQINNKLEVSEIEQPISKDEILSFADKYQRGGKKAGGMSSLARELPAHIPSKLQKEIIDIALKVFRIVRAKGLIRIDFMVVANKVYVTEVNPIPGSMSYYLWEASGVSFKNQITDLIQQSFVDAQSQNAKHISYSTDIVSKFINNRDR